MPTYPVRQMLVLYHRTEDLPAFLPETEVQTLQPVMNSAGHQFRVEFPIRIPGHVDIQSTPRIRQSEITDTPTQWFLLVRLMPRHQKKQPPIHTDSPPDSTADAPSKLVKKRRACWRRWGRHPACPPVVALIYSTAGRSGMRWASRPTSACLIDHRFGVSVVHETLGPEVEVGLIVLGGWRYHAHHVPAVESEDFLVGLLAGDQHVDVVEQCHRAFCMRDVPSSDASCEGDFAFPEKFDVFLFVFQEVWGCRFERYGPMFGSAVKVMLAPVFLISTDYVLSFWGEPQSPSSASLVVALR